MAGFEYMPEDRVERLEITINEIEQALEAPDFNEEDRKDVTDSLEYYRARRKACEKVGHKALQNA